MAKERFWFVNQLQPNSGVHTIAYGMDIDGPLDEKSVESALCAIVGRHDILRLPLVHTAAGLRQRFPDATEPSLTVVDIPPDSVEVTDESAHEEFDPICGPLFRATLLRTDQYRHRLVLAAHHAILDGWSFGVFLREFIELYRSAVAGTEPELPELEIQFGDYAIRQQEACSDSSFAADLDFWEKEFDDQPPQLALRLDFPRPELPSFRGSWSTGCVRPTASTSRCAMCSRRRPCGAWPDSRKGTADRAESR